MPAPRCCSLQPERRPQRPLVEALLILCFSGGAAEALHCGWLADTGEQSDNEMARRSLLGGSRSLLEMGTKIERARSAAAALIRTPLARKPALARALQMASPSTRT
jgi:hypothetical protein